VKQPLTTKILWFPELQLGLGLWEGNYDGLERQWLRWHDVNGQCLPTPMERAEQERQRAVQAEQQVWLERQRASEAVQRADKLAAKLRALGLDPEEL